MSNMPFAKTNTSWSKTKRRYPTVIEELCHEFSPADLRKSTNDFDYQNCLIGRGGLGKVYKCCLQHKHNDASDCTVAVKRFKVNSSEHSSGMKWSCSASFITLILYLYFSEFYVYFIIN